MNKERRIIGLALIGLGAWILTPPYPDAELLVVPVMMSVLKVDIATAFIYTYIFAGICFVAGVKLLNHRLKTYYYKIKRKLL